MKVVVIGGGISGLATAHLILRNGASRGGKPPDVTLLEQTARLGGNIITVREEGFVLDGGPDSWVATKPHAANLAKSLGLGDELQGTIPENRRALIEWEDKLHPLPEGFVLGVPTSVLPILRTPLFSPWAKARMALEPFVPRRRPTNEDDDESIESFIRRRLGAEVVERLVAPLLGGIYGGDAGKLSMRATLPQFVEMEAKHGSLIRALKASRAQTVRGGTKPSMFTTLKLGMGELVDRLASTLGQDRIRNSARVRKVVSLPPGDPRGRFAVELAGDTMHADHVVVAAPAHSAGEILRGVSDGLSRLLLSMQYASTGVVMLAFASGDVRCRLDATGYIVPRVLGRPALAATWVTSKWAHRAPEGQVLVRVFVGEAGHERLLDRDDEELVTLARAEVARTMQVEAAPSMTRVFRFRRAGLLPLVGHPRRIRQLRDLLTMTPGIHLVASGYDGVGIPDCVKQAEVASAAIVGG